jgi:subtilisin family serine protease
VVCGALLLALMLAVSPALAYVDAGGVLVQATAPASARVAVKLAPGSHLAQTAEGKLTVVRDWGSLTTAVKTSGLALRVGSRMASLGITVLEPLTRTGSGDETFDAVAQAKALRLMPGVLWAEAALPVQALLEPNDPYYLPSTYSVGQWALARLSLPEAWDITTGSASVTVAFVDTGLNGDASDFAGRIVSPYNAVLGSSAWADWQDDEGHGTAVAGVAVAQGNDGRGMAGTAWNVAIMPVRVAAEDGSIDDAAVAQGIEYAADHGADVINISLGTSMDVGQTVRDAVAYAIGKGVVIVAAAGNENGSSVDYPAALPGVIAVGATNRRDGRWSVSDGGSNGGADLDLMAPGANILSYDPGSPGKFSDDLIGTSVASPFVAGIVALMLSVNPLLTPVEVTNILTSTADDLGPPGWDADYGWGMVDADEAVARAAAGDSTTTTASTTTSTTTTTTTIPTGGHRFADVSEKTTPYWREIDYLAGLGIVTGSDDSLFHPQEGLKRQQFAKMILLALGSSVTEEIACPFVDLVHAPGDLYPYRYVAAAFRLGIVQGTNATHFSPYGTLTRAQLITMVARAAQLPEPPPSFVPEFPNFSSTHYPAARRAAHAGLLSGIVGMGPNYDFSAAASRGEVCALLYALLQ